MSTSNVKRLHWTQRIALVQHNLHAASRSGNFTFFKTLQAAAMMGGTNHFATLSATLGDEADAIMAAMDDLSSGIATIHQDAFHNVYDNLKDAMRDERSSQGNKSKLYADVVLQKSMAEATIDKLCNSAIALINQQPAVLDQDQAAEVFITGITLIADCVQIVIKELESIDQTVDDFIRLEDSWNIVKASVIGAKTGLKGVYYMLDTYEPYEEARRPVSIASASSSVFRRLSTAFQGSQSSASTTRNPSTESHNSASGSSQLYRSPTFVRNSVSFGCPTSMPSSPSANSTAFDVNTFNTFDSDAFTSFPPHKMETIPSPILSNEECDPFDKTNIGDVLPIVGLPIDNESSSSRVAVA